MPGAPAGVTFLALSFAAGITLGWSQPHPWVWPWLIASALLLLASMLLPRRTGDVWRLCLINLAMVALGAGWLAVRHHHYSSRDPAAWIGDEPVLLHLRGVALRGPELRARTSGSMAVFDYRKPATYFPMRIDAYIGRDGTSAPARGKVLVRVEETVPPFHAGDEIDVTGFLRRPGPPQNPGEFDYQRYALALGQAGVLYVRSRDLLHVRPGDRFAPVSAFLKWRDRLRRRAGAWLLSDLPETTGRERDALLATLLLGRRERHLAQIDEPFRRVGLAHLLAISGLHLGILVGFVLLLVSRGGHLRRWHGLLVIAVVLGYLLLVEVRMPVLRAGVMTMAAGVALLAGRRWRVASLVGLSALLLLLWRPDQIFNAGFQLSFGVVLALIHLTGPLRRAWLAPAKRSPVSSGQMMLEWLKSAAAAALVAWAVATPITIYHFGMISPWAVPLAVLALPIVALLLGIGYSKMLLAVLLPSGALLLGAVLSFIADVLISLVTAIDSLPGTMIRVPHPPAAWSIIALAWVVLGLSVRRVTRGRIAAWLAAGAVLGLWLTWPMLPLRAAPPLRIDMLAVGDGSCYVLRSGGETLLFDAGSSTNLSAGRQVIVPALRRLGVRSIDGIIISHSDLDHYSAVLEIADAFAVDRVLVTDRFLEAARSDPSGPTAYLLHGLARRRIATSPFAAGDHHRLGELHLDWLHPSPGDVYERANDNSMVIAIRAGGRAVLMTGDIQADAIADLLSRHPDLEADVLELPHHGRYLDATHELVDRLRPTVVMQSTGYTRWSRDTWGDALDGVERLVTARDGACRVEIDRAGNTTTGRFSDSGP
ncbi:MAG: DNA internalization-related competence protein ComEC/Rec2 [Planctomycetota bacterium]|nr:DNA internalization-related competence protein ComEC/Rec2 [Planctomycetota bacterium]